MSHSSFGCILYGELLSVTVLLLQQGSGCIPSFVRCTPGVQHKLMCKRFRCTPRYRFKKKYISYGELLKVTILLLHQGEAVFPHLIKCTCCAPGEQIMGAKSMDVFHSTGLRGLKARFAMY